MRTYSVDVTEKAWPDSAGMRRAEGTARRNEVPRRVEAAGHRLRVALVVEAAGGGVAVHIADMVRGLRARGGIDIHLIVPLGERFNKVLLNDDVLAQCDSIHRLPMLRSVGKSDTVAFARLFRCLNRLQPDVVHSHSSKAGALARLCFGPWKQVYTPHAVYTLNPYLPPAQRRFYGLIERMLGRMRSDRIIAVSLDEAKHLRDALCIPAARIETIFNGVPKAASLSAHEAREALALPHDAIVVGFVGRLDFQKGVDRLARVAGALIERGVENVVFAVIGPGDFAQAAELNGESVPSNVRVLGSVPAARRYFSAFDVFALPSRYEGFPYVLLESMAAHVPVVTTRVSGAGEFVDAEQIGFVVPNEDDVTLFTDALAALAADPAMRARMRQNCQRAVERFSISAMVEQTVALYQRVLKEKH